MNVCTFCPVQFVEKNRPVELRKKTGIVRSQLPHVIVCREGHMAGTQAGGLSN